MSALQVASVYIAINILMLVWFAMRVVARRFRGKISMGDVGPTCARDWIYAGSVDARSRDERWAAHFKAIGHGSDLDSDGRCVACHSVFGVYLGWHVHAALHDTSFSRQFSPNGTHDIAVFALRAFVCRREWRARLGRGHIAGRQHRLFRLRLRRVGDAFRS